MSFSREAGLNHPLRRKISLLICFVTLLAGPLCAQDNDITNEYRGTLVTSKPVSDKIILFQYLGYVSSPDKSVKTMYYSPPGVIYKPKKWLEVWGGLFGLYNWNKNTSNSWELRPLVGIKTYLPNKKKLNIYNFARGEYRFMNQNNNTKSQPRFRDRVGIEAPLKKGPKAWTPKTFYAFGDGEPMWRLDDKYLSVFRLRGGVGYIFSKKWRAEMIYHAEWTAAAKGQPLEYTGNIWRLNVKLMLPRKQVHHHHDIDLD